MISNRIYISIIVLMASILFLCMSLNQIKDELNEYEVNRYVELGQSSFSEKNNYIPQDFTVQEIDASEEFTTENKINSQRLVICIGNENDSSIKNVQEWITYTKRNIAHYSTLVDYMTLSNKEEFPELLVIDPISVDWTNENTFEFLNEFLKKGTSLIFLGVPDDSLIQANPLIRELMGIESILKNEVTVKGFLIEDGFLLGGNISYLNDSAEREDSFESKNLAFFGGNTFPWYLPSPNTTAYISGIPENDLEVSMDRKDYPMVLWGNSKENGQVFVGNKDIMSGLSAVGLFSAICAQIHSYELYPIVNAQTVVLTGFPSLTNENSEEIEQLYSRPITQVHQELMWPTIFELLKKYNYSATCMVAPQYDYLDEENPDQEVLKYFLKIFSEQFIEMGLDGTHSNASLPDKLETDAQLFQEALGGYDIVSLYAGDLEENQVLEGLNSPLLSSTRTIVRNFDSKDQYLLDYLSEDVTIQNILFDGLDFTYENDFLVRNLETGLGYFNISYDLSQIDGSDENQTNWVDLSKLMKSVISFYGQQYPYFDRTTTAEADARIRRFLAMDFTQSRTGDQIEVNIKNVNEEPVWFILRTQNEEIQAMKGGSWTKLEKGAYLLEITESSALITLRAI